MPPATPDAARDDRLVWLDLEMTGLDVTRHVIVEIAALVTNGELEPLDEGIDIVVHQPPVALAEMDDFVRAMHTRSALLPEIEASTVALADAGAQTLEYVRRHVPEAMTAPPVRQLDRRRPPVPRPPAPRARPLPALPQRRRLELQGAVPALVPGRLQEAAREDGNPPRARRHQRVDRGAALLPGAHAAHRTFIVTTRCPQMTAG